MYAALGASRMMRYCSFILMYGAVILICEGCVATDQESAVAFHEATGVTEKGDPLLRIGDRVQITVFGEDGISGSYEISPRGQVQLPLAGAIAAEGQSPRELEKKVIAALRLKYLRDPKVTVSVLTVSPFYVLGEVEKPGEYPFRPGLNVWRALAVAGGQTYRASTDAVLIQHAGESRIAEVDLAHDTAIKPGDLIRVPERWF